jgi:ubiquinone/menaquinone biosynthesis C-methylase UbiE
MYERELVEPLFRPFAEILLDRTAVARADRLLDVACGTGIVARLAKGRLGHSGRIVGIDVNQQMLAVARAIAPDIEWREGKAESLPVDDGEQFDVLICNQGLQFFADKPAATSEMRRVLASRGRVAVAIWRSIEENPIFGDLQRVAERHVGTIVDRRHNFGDAAAIEQLLAGAGFNDIRIETLSRTVRFEEASTFVRLNTMAVVGMSAAAPSLDEEQRAKAVAAIGQDSLAVLPPYLEGNGLAFEISTNIATARR